MEEGARPGHKQRVKREAPGIVTDRELNKGTEGHKKKGIQAADTPSKAKKIQSSTAHIAGTWDARSMSQGKLGLDIAILGESELKWSGMSHFGSDNYIVSYSGN